MEKFESFSIPGTFQPPRSFVDLEPLFLASIIVCLAFFFFSCQVTSCVFRWFKDGATHTPKIYKGLSELLCPSVEPSPTSSIKKPSQKMFSKVALLSVASLVLSAAAQGNSQCNTGPIQCCQSVYQSQSKAGAGLASLVGVAVQNVNALVGFDCSPITASVIGAAAGSGAEWYVHVACP
jgi:hypothetical protein